MLDPYMVCATLLLAGASAFVNGCAAAATNAKHAATKVAVAKLKRRGVGFVAIMKGLYPRRLNV